MYQRQLSEIEVEKHARKLLDEWASKVAAGHQIPDPILSIQSKPEPISTLQTPVAIPTIHQVEASDACLTRRHSEV